MKNRTLKKDFKKYNSKAKRKIIKYKKSLIMKYN